MTDKERALKEELRDILRKYDASIEVNLIDDFIIANLWDETKTMASQVDLGFGFIDGELKVENEK